MLEEFVEKFNKACSIRFADEDIDWKPTQRRDKATNQMVAGTPLAYLNWAIAWRTFKEIYPEGKINVLEHDGDPLWVINGYGMVKIEGVVCGGISHTEYFPVMQGGANDSMPIVDIDGRDINDAIQRGSVKVMARFGIGLYIYEGKLTAKPKAQPQGEAPKAPLPASPKQRETIARLLIERKKTIVEMGYQSIDNLNIKEASDLLDKLFKMPRVQEPKPQEPKAEEEKDDLPF